MKEQNTDTRRFALIGNPLRHSVSPLIHQTLCNSKGIAVRYNLCEVEESALPAVFEKELRQLNGFNVTIPYKEDIMPLLDELSPKAALFGAVNTVYIRDGYAVGYNTDSEGFLRSLKAAGFTLGGDVLITGCGGVSRMFAFESIMAGASVTLAIRESSFEKAERLQKEIRRKLSENVRILRLDEVRADYTLIINGTPVGMYPHTEASPLSPDAVRHGAAVFDAIYNPSETRLLRYAREAGIPYLNGLPMLVWQAAIAEEIWNGVHFTEDEVQRVITLTKKETDR